MNELVLIENACRRCGGAVDEASNFCSHCGLPTASDYPNVPVEVLEPCLVPEVNQAGTVPAVSASPAVSVLDNRWAVIAILLCAGPLGLPALWLSRRFSPRTKVLTTIGYLIVTVVVPLAVAWYFLEVAIRPVVDALGG